jgi:hypothetical protein
MDLIGHSNDKLMKEMHKQGYNIIKNGSIRLNNQIVKQKLYKDLISNSPFRTNFYVPDASMASDHSAEIEYVHGINIVSALSSENLSTIDYIINNIFKFIEWELNQSKFVKFNKDIFINKINSIQNLDDDIKQAINVLISKIRGYDGKIIIGFCHGDLTFSNMLFDNNNRIILFDFLNCYLETPLQDIGKLLQEINLQWSRFFLKDIDEMKTNILYNYLKKSVDIRIKDLVKKYNINSFTLNLVYLLVLLRIFPYSKSNEIYDTVKKHFIKGVEKL